MCLCVKSIPSEGLHDAGYDGELDTGTAHANNTCCRNTGSIEDVEIQDIINNLDIHVMRLLYPHGFV